MSWGPAALCPGLCLKGKKWCCAGFLKGSNIFLGGCFAKCSRATWDGGKGMVSAFLVLAMTWGPRAGALLRPGTPGLQEWKEFGKEERKRPVLESSCTSESKQECSVTAGLFPPKRQQVPGALPARGGRDLLNSCSKSIFKEKKLL